MDPSLENLRDLQWKNRIVLISADSDTEEWIDILRDSDLEIIDRDIAWFSYYEGSLTSNLPNALTDSFVQHIVDRYFSHERTRVVLIGKDGGVKDVSSDLDLSQLFALIDGMPMRRAEIRARSK